MLDSLGRIICKQCKSAMDYRTMVEDEGACFVFYCSECDHGDVYRISTAHVRNTKRHPPINLDLTLPTGTRARRRIGDRAYYNRRQTQALDPERGSRP